MIFQGHALPTPAFSNTSHYEELEITTVKGDEKEYIAALLFFYEKIPSRTARFLLLPFPGSTSTKRSRMSKGTRGNALPHFFSTENDIPGPRVLLMLSLDSLTTSKPTKPKGTRASRRGPPVRYGTSGENKVKADESIEKKHPPYGKSHASYQSFPSLLHEQTKKVKGDNSVEREDLVQGRTVRGEEHLELECFTALAVESTSTILHELTFKSHTLPIHCFPFHLTNKPRKSKGTRASRRGTSSTVSHASYLLLCFSSHEQTKKVKGDDSVEREDRGTVASKNELHEEKSISKSVAHPVATTRREDEYLEFTREAHESSSDPPKSSYASSSSPSERPVPRRKRGCHRKLHALLHPQAGPHLRLRLQGDGRSTREKEWAELDRYDTALRVFTRQKRIRAVRILTISVNSLHEK
ncbi:hypothetical protein BJ508DRAFT_309592 [Ascobolus immersus RN42]|uniref:Uncharacterized protein n=1 Tax=Ascobolus immersus RN42 TaxID=1160509 RepID=A0A3N4I062_ASCIM|nr:hypothetical protein BJ508DRAFT_309592 [Ascobolus immersus RN42]